MTDETGVAPQEATEEAVVEDQTPDTEAQAEGQTAGDDTAPAPEGGERDDDSPEATEKKSRHQKRKEAMERAFREAEEARAELAKAQARLQEFEQMAKSAKPPKQDDFQTYEDYQAALSGYYAMQQLDGREAARIRKEQEAHQQKIEQIEQRQSAEVAQQWAAQTAEAKTRYADFEQVALSPNVPITPEMGRIIQSMDSGADVAYHLGMNTAEAARISQLPPIYAAMELARIEARLSGPKPRTSTQAPDPIAPVKPKATPRKDPAKMTMAEYKAARSRGEI
jgi:hypothetical protein